MRTIKAKFNPKNIYSNRYREMLIDYDQDDLIRIVLYYLEDCGKYNELTKLYREWLVTKNYKTLEKARHASYFVYVVGSVDCVIRTVYDICKSMPSNLQKKKQLEYKNYARLFAFEDLDFPYREEAKSFNLDDNTDLNIFLDFLTDNYPEALIYSREEFINERLPKEYLKMIYQ